jgi:hypothetical protein
MRRFPFSLTRKLSAAAAALAVIAVAATAPLVAPGSLVSGSVATGTKAAVGSCPTAALVIWLDTMGDGTAGSIYYKLEFTNLSGRACSLFGFPGVSAADLGGHPLGSAASRNYQAPDRRVTLASGSTATVLLQITEAGNFPSVACHRVSAASLRVFPPGQTTSKLVPYPFDACSRSGPVYLHVDAVQ